MLTLTDGVDVASLSQDNQCIVSLGSTDILTASAASVTILAGEGDDVVQAGGLGTNLIRGGAGRDTLFGFGGDDTIFGNDGDDAIFGGNGNNIVIPGPGIDTVTTGVGDDKVIIFDLCEVATGETIAAGDGFDTLVTPVPLEELQALGVTVSGFEEVVVQANSCASDCSTSCEIESLDTPVSLLAKRAPDGTETLGKSDPLEPVEFRVPERLEVLVGNAGNGRSELTFEISGTEVVCLYRGGAASTPAIGSLETAKGAFYNFESCTEGVQVNDIVQAKKFRLRILDSHPDTRLAVQLGLGDGCSFSMGYPIDPEDSIVLRDAFDWAATTPLPELDAQGRPNLFYASIYLENSEQRELLDVAQIHYRFKPLLFSEWEPFLGKCGAFNFAGDGEGAFVFAVVPAVTYNLIRSAALDPELEDDGTLFRAFPLRAIPSEMENAEGAFSYEILAEEGFTYRPEDDETSEEELILQPFGFGSVIRAAGSAVGGAGDLIKRGLAEVDRRISGSVEARVDPNILNRDQVFVGVNPVIMQRMWGSRTGDELTLPGVRIEVQTTRLGLGLFETTRDAGNDGRANMAVPEGAKGSSLCMNLKNDAAQLEAFPSIDSVIQFCDARGVSGSFNQDRDLVWAVRIGEPTF